MTKAIRFQPCRQRSLQQQTKRLLVRPRTRPYHTFCALDNHDLAIQPKPSQDFLQIQKSHAIGSYQFRGLQISNMSNTSANIAPSILYQIRNLSTSNDPSPIVDYTSVSSVLEQRLQEGSLKEDKAQNRLAKRLSRLQEALVGYDNAILFETEEEADDDDEKDDVDVKTEVAKGEEKDEIRQEPKVKLQIPRGLYIHGPVGTGKTMLMDAFYANAPSTTDEGHSKKKRYHFHAFLAQVHQRIHQLKQQDLEQHGRSFSIDTSISNNPIYKVGMEWSQQVSLLCLDEFQVTDIADALILSQLFGVLFHHGTVVVATSNRPPQDLYEGGLNRNYFLPFIDLLQHHCITHAIASPIDYRKVLSDRTSFFLTPGDRNQHPAATVDAMVQALVVGESGESVLPSPMTLSVGFQRTLEIPLAYTKPGDTTNPSLLKVARFDFKELCDRELGAMDYRAIAQEFQVIILQDIPIMDLEGHNVARRFITLIDEVYEGNCALLCSTLADDEGAVQTPMDLFSGASETHGRSSQANEEETIEKDEKKSVFMGVDVAQEGGMPVGALASVRELSFAFERSASRMFEMTSRPWWDRVLLGSGFEEEEK